MNPILNRVGIKAEAKKFIGYNSRWGSMFFATALVYIASSVFGIASQWAAVEEHSGFSILFSSPIFNILVIPFTVSVAGYYLNQIRGYNPEWKSLYREAIDRFGKYLATGILVSVFTILWSFLFIIPGIVMGIAYSQARYIIHDNPSLSATDAISISKKITQGFKGDLFEMYLSFFGWYILIGLTGGLLSVYVLPYLETTSAMYYENLKRNAIERNIVPESAFGYPMQNNTPYTQNAEPNAPQNVNPQNEAQNTQANFYAPQANTNAQPSNPYTQQSAYSIPTPPKANEEPENLEQQDNQNDNPTSF